MEQLVKSSVLAVIFFLGLKESNWFVVVNSTLNGAAFMRDIREEKDQMKSDLKVDETNRRNQEGLMITENEAVLNNKLEAVVILLKQAAIPFVIALENTKDDLNDLQTQVKVF